MQSTSIPSELESVLLAPPRTAPRVEHLAPFLRAAREVLEIELNTVVEPGEVLVASASLTRHDVTAIVGMTGELTGLAFYAMAEETAKAMVGHLMGERVTELDELGLSAIAELANMTTGRAAGLLADDGCWVNIAPPLLVCGVGARFSTAGIPRLLVPLRTALGEIEFQLAIKLSR